MLREWLRKRLVKLLREDPQDRIKGSLISAPKLSDYLTSGAPMMTVWSISNGYLLVGSMDSMRMMESTVIYVKDVIEIGEQIATMRARTAMGVPPSTNTGYAAFTRSP
jgi:hypothetical protein